ncbi:exodeoxyribonuclease III [endosymbiont of Ridgeia piscesae]|jgi:exodeoxyribonuclease-3|uniref:Exodeoxyribonuclease III n=1 Tax=endosymbiont of Ridgeia piscesae TaxID=54398 RepID=A0A0T5YWP4_9GAMM|nr:exodeoxyribonuclease III [endosymbiont of Ridgeia piscesae]KRT55015.1 Exodeoxyribonuclease III [endosymbiont of Ridgeia piscesae]KRT58015.1 Exodeoxyribonuclease III [endosymbiont of Ridgeia piscesae]
MKIVSFNTNGIRTREHQLQQLKQRHDPDVIGIQESKVQDQDFPLEMTSALGFNAAYFGQKTHYGVALLSKQAPLSLQKGFPGDPVDAQRRMIIGRFATDKGNQVTVINGYFPQGENQSHEVKYPAKRKFYADLLAYLQQHHSPDDNLLVIGDMNIAPLDLDIGIGPDNAKRWLKSGKCCFLPEEREWLQRLTDWGLHDTFRGHYPEVDDRFSWFDYRSRGFDREPKRGLRIDLILASASLNAACSDAGIDYEIRGMQKPSDHCPIWAEFDI